MSLFDYPRIHFSGTCTLNPGTANNDDYSGSYSWPKTGENLALIDSAAVQPRTFGMSDNAFRAWIQKPQTFEQKHAPTDGDAPPRNDAGGATSTAEIIPAEWNYYGDMGSDVSAAVTGVQIDPADAPPAQDRSGLEALVGQTVSFRGNITDVNSEGSPPATQFFIAAGTLGIGKTTLQGTPSKGACQWINFVRNVNLTADAGAGGYIYHVVEGGHVGLSGFDAPGISGVILRYYLFARHGGASDNTAIARLYKHRKTNAAELQIVGTIAPLHGSETVRTGPVGRLLTCAVPAVPTLQGDRNNLSPSGAPTKIPLAPAVLHTDGDRVSIDAIGTFPERFADSGSAAWDETDKTNPKYDFGPVALRILGSDGRAAKVGPVPYADTAAGNAGGWIFDFDLSGNAEAKQLLSDPSARFSVDHNMLGSVLAETEYYVTTNAQAIYAEQNGAGDCFRNQGAATEPASFEVFHRGRALTASDAPPITLWGYRTTPLNYAGELQKLQDDYVPGAPISVPTDAPGTFLFTLSIGDEPPPPQTYADYIGPPFTTLTDRTAISLRVLPNEDYSEYLDGPAEAPVGNERLTFDVVYRHVLRTYDLLFPAMNGVFNLGDRATVEASASAILKRTDPAMWASPRYMPITRDLSESRRTLLQAWCRKVSAAGSRDEPSVAAE